MQENQKQYFQLGILIPGFLAIRFAVVKNRFQIGCMVLLAFIEI